MDEQDPDRTRVAVVDPLVGSVLDRRYRIEFRLAAGGFGAIYRATHVIHRRAVALKVLHTTLATEPNVVARFRREAQALGALRDRHTIMAYDFGETSDGTLYIAMELLQGESLFERFRALGPLPWRRMVTIAMQVCSSLAEAHGLGIVHRDLKPTNIHLEPLGGDPDFVKVLDFGIAKILHGSQLDNADLTRSGQMVGTFDYMAPEQMVGGAVSPQSDIYTLGVLIYEMISGEPPFPGMETPAEMLTAMLSKTPRRLSSISVAPRELDPIVARCLDRDPLKRYPSAAQLADDLARVLVIDDEHTQLSDFVDDEGDETATTIDKAPEAPDGRDSHDSLDGNAGLEGPTMTAPVDIPEGPTTKPQPAAVDPRTTLPGVAPPDKNKPWPIAKTPNPRRKR